MKRKRVELAGYLDTKKSQTDLLTAAFKSGNANSIKNAFGMIIQAQGLIEIAKTAGVARKVLFRAEVDHEAPPLDVMFNVLAALGMKKATVPKTPPKSARRPARKSARSAKA